MLRELRENHNIDKGVVVSLEAKQGTLFFFLLKTENGCDKLP